MDEITAKAGHQGIFRSHPAANYFLLCLITVSYAVQVICDPEGRWIQPLILRSWSWTGLSGYLWVHMGPIHMLESVVTLWIFGRFVARHLSAGLYVTSFFLLGLIAAASHLLLDPRPAVGASGAIMGILGMHVILCGNRHGAFEPFLALAWFIISLVMAIAHMGPAAHVAHLAGFLSGMTLAILLVVTGQADSDEMSPTLRDRLIKAWPATEPA